MAVAVGLIESESVAAAGAWVEEVRAQHLEGRGQRRATVRCLVAGSRGTTACLIQEAVHGTRVHPLLSDADAARYQMTDAGRSASGRPLGESLRRLITRIDVVS